MPITGVHAMFNSPKADEIRVFLRDKCGLDASDVGGGWLIFPLAGEVGAHPDEKTWHELSFVCDDIEATRAEMERRGVEFTSPVKDQRFGLTTTFNLPDDTEVMLYQPKYRLD